MIAGQRYHFLALRGFSFLMIVFSRSFSCVVKTLSLSFLLKSERLHHSSQKFFLCYQYFSCLIIVGKVVNLLLTFVIGMILFHVRFMSFWPEVMVSKRVFNYMSVPFKCLMKNCVD